MVLSATHANAARGLARRVDPSFCNAVLAETPHFGDENGPPKLPPLIPVVPQPELEIVPVEEEKPDHNKPPEEISDDILRKAWIPKKKPVPRPS